MLPYTFFAVATGLFVAGASAAPLVKRANSTTSITYDDQGGNITYSGTWSTLTNETMEGLYNNTESFTSANNGTAYIILPGEAGVNYTTDITITAVMKADRGNFQVFIDNEQPYNLVGQGAEFSANLTNSTIVFNHTGVAYTGAQRLLIVNYDDRVYGAKFFGIDSVTFNYTQA